MCTMYGGRQANKVQQSEILEPSLALFIPPKQEQAFLQGGTFVFEGSKTLFAHYDESTAVHAPLEQVVDLAKEKAASKVGSS